MNAIAPFVFDDQPLRVFDRGGQPWFVLADVCTLLGLKNPSVAVKPLDETERAKIFLGSGSDATIVSLPGLLTLMVRCRGALKPGTTAYRVRKWVTADVVPTVLRTGTYGQPAPRIDLRDPAVLQRLVSELASYGIEGQARISELEPQAEALARLTDAGGALAPTHAAKAMGVKPGKLFEWLEDNRWFYRGADGFVGFQPKIDTGYIVHKIERIARPRREPKLVNRALLTPKGIAKLTELGAGRA